MPYAFASFAVARPMSPYPANVSRLGLGLGGWDGELDMDRIVDKRH